MITNLDTEIDSEDLREIFVCEDIFGKRQDGDIKSCDIHTGSDGASKGTGEVVFRRRSDALRAIEELDGAWTAPARGGCVAPRVCCRR